MRTTLRFAAAAGLVSVGYVLGSSQVTTPNLLKAQDEVNAAPTEETVDKVKLALESIQVAQDALIAENFYMPAIDGPNSFAVSVGGLDALNDLKSGRGVDPETFVGLYSGMATEEVQDDLARDAEGRLTYGGKLVRLYSISRLKQIYASRRALLGNEKKSTTTDPDDS
jgi:hypothetical protein